MKMGLHYSCVGTETEWQVGSEKKEIEYRVPAMN